MKVLPMIAGLLSAVAATADERPVLTVYTYDSFVAEWGPGPAIEAGFEAACGCDLQYVTAGDGAALLSRLKLEGAGTGADVVVGLDQNLIAEARATGLFAPLPDGLPPPKLPVDWNDPDFVPFDWGWFAFVYDRTLVPEPSDSFEALAASDLRVVIQDPRSSTPGLGLLLWVRAAYGDQATEIWKGLADNIVTVTPGWSEAYGLFLEGEADMVLSYTTSPAYHLIAESDGSKAAAEFSEGHFIQVEVAAALSDSDQPELAAGFLRYLLHDAAQSVLPTANWMYPAQTLSAGLPKGFETLVRPEKTLFLTPDEAREQRDAALAEWLEALGR